MSLLGLESAKPRSVSWATPKWILEAFEPYFDPCPITGLDEVLLDGLAKDWPGFVFLNPPYGARRIGPWIHRAVEHGNCAVLVPARMDTGWFAALAKPASFFWFPKGRIKFTSHSGILEHGPMFPSVIVAIGSTAEGRLLRLAGKYPGLLVRR